jgi:3',5'-cyclic AMP phosphodiesterase CpdA
MVAEDLPTQNRPRSAAINRNDPPTVRLAHFSDIHVTAPVCAWRRDDWFNKRLAAWINLRWLGRGHHFRHTEAVLHALGGELTGRAVDRVVFSGDATALGFDEEMARAADLLGVGRLPGLAVPGNHDYCTPRAARSGDFERHFAPWLTGERVSADVYPFAQRVGHLWLVGVNSAVANHWAWDARGAVGEAQLQRLEKLLERLEGGPRVLVTHYPVALASGKPEHSWHLLRDLDSLLGVARRGGIGLWLHGHRHDVYHLTPSEVVPFPVLCAGSATQAGLWSYGEYTIRGTRLEAQVRVYDPATGAFRDGESFRLELPCRPDVAEGATP